jgi:serine/threonine protein kinase
MLIGRGGYSKVWHPPRKDRFIDSPYKGNKKYVQRLTNESLVQISNGQHARTIFDPLKTRSSPLIAIYERPNNFYSEIRPYRDDSLYDLLSTNLGKDNLPLFCKLLQNMEEIMKGLVSLHKKKWIHHDIKTSNILYDKNPFQLFLIDWGTTTRLRDAYDDSYRRWFEADNSNHPPEYKSYAQYKFNFQWKEDFATEYANNVYIFTLLKIQPNYMTMLNKAHDHIQKELKTNGKEFLIKLAPKVDVFAIGLVLSQIYLLLAVSQLYSTPFHSKIIHLLKGMTHPDPVKRWTMKRSVQVMKPLVSQACSFIK